jgi:hypothetical protein
MTGPPSNRPTTETLAVLRVLPSHNQSDVPEERVAGPPGAGKAIPLPLKPPQEAETR